MGTRAPGSEDATPAHAEARGRDRRQRHYRALLYSAFKRRRRSLRRDHDLKYHFYVDWHEPWLLALALAIIFLCVVDAYLTLAILERGGEEVNPLMRWLLENNSQVFLGVKLALTASCIAFTIAHKRFRLLKTISGYHILWTVFLTYVGLIGYQLALLSV